ncbi:MAG TPA: FMN-binding protein [Vicinamibacterales bacterium]|nr:FMN-binding protein [Vicinamibacterales bacterium]
MAPARARLTHNLVALSSAAVVVVYTAGYARTRQAAERLAAAADRPRAVLPAAPVAGTVVAALPAPAASPVATPASPVASGATTAPLTASKPKVASSRRAKVTPSPVATTDVVSAPAAPTTPAAAEATPTATPASTVTPASTATPTSTATTPTPAATPTPSPTLRLPPGMYKDGTYYGWGTSRHGDIQATVVIEDGRITSATITQCLTRYSCSWIAHLQGQVVARQSPEVDYVSGATQSTNAFYYAVVEALGKAK